MASFQRYSISGSVVTRSPLHIGSGMRVPLAALYPDAAKDEGPTVADVQRDVGGKPRLTESSLRGAICAYLRRHFPESRRHVSILFADDSTQAREHESRRQGLVSLKCGSGESHDDSIDAPFWNAECLTAITASPAIARDTGAVQDAKLAHEAYVPAGIAFPFRIDLEYRWEGTQQAENQDDAWRAIAWLLVALDSLQHDRSPLLLGANTADGWGALRLVDGKTVVSSLSSQNALDAVTRADRACGFALNRPLQGRAAKEIEKYRRAFADTRVRPRELQIQLDLQLDEHFGVGVADPRDSSGRSAVFEGPALQRSFRRRLGASVERILRTIKVPVHGEHEATGCQRTKGRRLPLSPEEDVCLACALFGATGWASVVRCVEFTPYEASPPLQEHERIAIDRVSGGAEDRKLFGRLVPHGGDGLTYRVGLVVDLERLQHTARYEAALGALILALRDVVEGDVTIGFSSAVGYGAFSGKVSVVHQPDAAEGAMLPRVLFNEKTRANGTSDGYVRALVSSLRALSTVANDDRDRQGIGEQLNAIPTPDATPADCLGSEFERRGDGLEPPSGSFFPQRQYVPIVDGPSLSDHVITAERPIAPQMTHARYVSGTHSGRVRVRATTLTHTITGGKLIKGDKDAHEPARLEQFARGGKPCLSTTGLRGVVSSVMEAASNSARRIFENRVLASREGTKARGDGWSGPLPCVGRIEKDGEALVMRPLAGPPMGGHVTLPSHGLEWAGAGERGRRVYLLGGNGNAGQQAVTTLLGALSVPEAGLPEVALDWTKITAGPTGRLTPKIKQPIGLDLGWQVDATKVSAALRPWHVDLEGDARWVRGCVLLLHHNDRKLPGLKKHSSFIPLHEEVRSIPIAPVALEMFERLVAERQTTADEELKGAAILPYAPVGSRWMKGKARDLRPGDIVYFDVAEFTSSDGRGRLAVSRIALSSVWRRPLEGRMSSRTYELATTHAFVHGIGEHGPEKLPMHPGRTTISIAESIMGWTSARYTKELPAPRRLDRNDERDETRPAPPEAYASRVRFRSACAANGQAVAFTEETYYLPPTQRPSLSCVELVHVTRNGGRVDVETASPGDTHLQGSRFAVHSVDHGMLTDAQFRQTATDKWHLFTAVRPMKPHNEFAFDVHFDNLTDGELGLLLLSLEPSRHFAHKVGRGKSHGLGSVHLAVQCVGLVERAARYTVDGIARGREMEAPPAWTTSLRDVVRDQLEETIARALFTVGETWVTRSSPPVIQGQSVQQPPIGGGYLFSTANRAASAHHREYLRPITQKGVLPSMRELPPPERNMYFVFRDESAPGWNAAPDRRRRTQQLLSALLQEQDMVLVFVDFDIVPEAARHRWHRQITNAQVATFLQG